MTHATRCAKRKSGITTGITNRRANVLRCPAARQPAGVRPHLAVTRSNERVTASLPLRGFKAKALTTIVNVSPSRTGSQAKRGWSGAGPKPPLAHGLGDPYPNSSPTQLPPNPQASQLALFAAGHLLKRHSVAQSNPLQNVRVQRTRMLSGTDTNQENGGPPLDRDVPP